MGSARNAIDDGFETYRAAGNSAAHAHDPAAAEAAFRLALIEARKEADSVHLGDAHGGLAEALDRQGRHVEAFTHYRQSIAAYEEAGCLDEPVVLSLLWRTASCALSCDDVIGAELAYRRAVALIEVKTGEEDELAHALAGLADVFVAKGQPRQASEILDRLVSMVEAGGKGPRRFAMLSEAFYLADKLGHLVKAEILANAMLAAADADGDDQALALALNETGRLYLTREKPDLAVAMLGRALNIRRRLLGADDGATLTTQVNLAIALSKIGRSAQALALLGEVLALRERQQGPDGEDLPAVLNNLALFCKDLGNAVEAERYLRRAVAIARKTRARHDPPVVLLDNLAGILQESGRLEEAEALYTEAIALGERAFGVDHPDLAVSYNNLASLLKRKGQLDQAISNLLRALQICERSFEIDHEGFRVVLAGLVDLELKRKRPAHAKKWARRLLPLLERFEGAAAADLWRQQLKSSAEPSKSSPNCIR